MGEGEGSADPTEGTDEQREPHRAHTPGPVSAAVRESHRLSGHAVYRSWCDACCAGRGREAPHRRGNQGYDIPVLSWDYCYLGSGTPGVDTQEVEDEAEAQGENPVLVSFDSRSKAIAGLMHGAKDTVAMWTKYVERLGYRRVVFRSDNEPALLAFLDKLRENLSGEVVVEGSPVGDPQSNGAAEMAVGQLKGLVRTLKYSVEQRLQTRIPDDHPILAWLVVHAGACQRRFTVGVDGKTPMERLVERRCGVEMAEFGEQVMAGVGGEGMEPRFEPGFFLGPVEGRNQVWGSHSRTGCKW